MTKLTVLPATVQTLGVELANVTGLPEAPPVAATAYVPPTVGNAGGVDVKVIA